MSEAVSVELVEGIDATVFKSRLAILVGVAAVAAALLAVLEGELSAREHRASAEATRVAARVSTGIGASSTQVFFKIGLLRDLATAATAAQAGALLATSPLERAQLQADAAANQRLTAEAASTLTRQPDAASGLDRYALDTLNVSEAELQALSLEQGAAADRAASYARRSGRATLGLSLVAIAGSLLGLAGVLGAGRGGSIALGGGAAALAIALAAGFTALV